MNNMKFIPRFGRNINNIGILNRKILQHLKVQPYCNSHAAKEIEEDENFFSKIIYNEVLYKHIQRKNKSSKKSGTEPRPIFLKFLFKNENKVNNNLVENSVIEEQEKTLHFPYEIKQKFLKEVKNSSSYTDELPETTDCITSSDDVKIDALEWNSTKIKINLEHLERPEKWINNHIKNEWLRNDNTDVFKWGTADCDIKPSTVPCGGCGALLHCNDPSLPGFIPSEVFKVKEKNELRAEICQRCHFLREYDVSLGVNVSTSEYIKILEQIREKEALVILVIDLLDFPCSIFPNILNTIGPKKPIVIVGNKVDLLIQEGPSFMYNFKNALYKSLKKQKINFDNIKYISLISAKTGYGIENLINQLHLNWRNKGDVYLIGCTNVGKSTLFNALIQSDYCKSRAVDLVQRATVSAWPGTTLNLLKFPIMKPTDSRIIARAKRLKFQVKEEKALQTFQWLGQNLKFEQIPLQGYVGRTFTCNNQKNDSQSAEKPKGINPSNCEFKSGNWFYDTPGVVHEDQIINLLTTPELLLTIPKKMLLPRNFHVQPETSIFIAGLARLDYISGADFVWFTVFASMELPITVTKLKDADFIYKKLLGSSLFRVPMKEPERLAKWPNLSSKKFEIFGSQNEHNMPEKITGKVADADVVLSSAGWISVCVPRGYRCKMEAWTPEGKGIHLRDCPIIHKGFDFKGVKIAGTPAFENVIKEVKGRSVTDEPPY